MTPSQHGLLQGLRHGAPAEGPLSGRVQAQVQPSICSTPKHSHGGGAPCGQMFGRAPRLSAMAPGSSASHVIDHAELSGPSSRASVALEMMVPNQGCLGDTSRRVPLLPNRFLMRQVTSSSSSKARAGTSSSSQRGRRRAGGWWNWCSCSCTTKGCSSSGGGGWGWAGCAYG